MARSITTNGTTLYLTADAEDRYTRFDFNTGPGQGSAYAYEYYNGLGLRTFRHDVWGHDFPEAYDGASPGSALLSSGFASSGQTLFTPGLVQQDGNGQHFYQTDALGSVRGVSGNNQAPQGEVYYDAFGLPSVRQGSAPSPLGFAGAAGYQTDADTGLMLLGNRYYDPSIGRFLSADPSGSGDNWYAYCDNDPLTRTDPTGNEAQTINGGGVGSAMWVSMTAGPAQLISDMELYQEADQYNYQLDAYKKSKSQHNKDGSVTEYKTQDDAARAASAYMTTNGKFHISDTEYGGFINILNDGKYIFSGPFTSGSEDHVQLAPYFNNDTSQSYYHTHPTSSLDGFSNADIRFADRFNINAYVFGTGVNHDYKYSYIPQNPINQPGAPDHGLYTGPGVTQFYPF